MSNVNAGWEKTWGWGPGMCAVLGKGEGGWREVRGLSFTDLHNDTAGWGKRRRGLKFV